MPIFGISAAIGTAILGIGSFLAGGTALAQIALAGLSMAANYAYSKLFGPKPPAARASQLETRYGEKLARDIVQNRVGTAGHHVYRNAYGPGNRTVQDVFILSHWNIADVTRVRFKGEWKTLGGVVNPERGQRIQDIDAEIWVKVYTGRMDQVADAGLIARSNPPGRWTENHRGAGVAYAVVTNVLTRAHLPSPWEAFFEVEGVTYDWRRDSTVGGDGPHRYDDPTTWEPTTNPALMAYCATRGFYRGTEKIAGKGRSASALPLAQWTLAANICDEIVSGKKRYQAACILSSGEGATHDANLRPLMEACAGSWLEMVGQEYPIVGANQTPVTSFTDDDLIVDEAFRFSAYRTRSELVNTLAGTFVDPESFYQAMPLATRTDAAALAQDRERLAVPLTWSVVTEPACADRLADIALRASRYQASADLCLLPKYLALKPGQWVTWTSAHYGWTKVFQVQGKRLGAFGPKSARSVFVSLQEVGDGIFDPTAYATTPPGSVPQGGPTYQSELQDLVVVGITVKDEDSGKQYPAIRAAWTAIEDPTVIGVDFRYRLKAQPDIELPHPTVPDDVRLTTIANGVVSNTLYELSHRLVTSPFRQTPWTAWVEVLTLDTPPTDFVFPPGVVEGIEQWVNDQIDWLDEDSPLYPLGQDIYELDEKVGIMEAEIAGIVGAPDYDPLATYNEGDLVAYDGGLYRALQTTTGNVPTNTTYWEKIGDYASLGDAVIALQARVSEAENEIEKTQDGFRSTTRDSRRIYNAAIIPALLEVEKAGETALEAADQFKATAAVGQWAETEISRVDGVLTIQAAAITLVQASLDGKADTSVTQALQAAITQQGNDIASQGSAVTSLQSALTGYTGAGAVSSAFTEINTSVSIVNGIVSTQASRLDDLYIAMGGDSQSIRSKWELVGGPAGYTRYGLRLLTTAGGERGITMFGDVPNNADLKMRWLFDAEQFIIRSGSTEHNVFMVEDGGITAYFARLAEVTANLVKTPTNKAQFGLLAPGVEGLTVTT